MAADLLPFMARATDANGDPLPGAKWYFYYHGTSTPLAVYADADMETSLGAVVTADSGGLFVPIYLDATVAYRGVLKSSDGSITVFDISPINATFYSDLVLNFGSNTKTIADDEYTVLAADLARTLYFTSATDVTVTVPTGLGANFACILFQASTGQVIVEDGVGVTLRNKDNEFATLEQGVGLKLWAHDTNSLWLEGETA